MPKPLFDQTRTDYKVGYRICKRYGLEAFKVTNVSDKTVVYVNHVNREQRELKHSMDHSWYFDFEQARVDAINMQQRKAERAYTDYTEAYDCAEELIATDKASVLANAAITEPEHADG